MTNLKKVEYMNIEIDGKLSYDKNTEKMSATKLGNSKFTMASMRIFGIIVKLMTICI